MRAHSPPARECVLAWPGGEGCVCRSIPESVPVMGRNIVRSAAGDVFAICFFHAQDAVYSLSRIALPPPAGRATSHERSNSAEEKIGRCPHQATLRVLGVVASSGPAVQKSGPLTSRYRGDTARGCFARRLARRCLHCAIIATARWPSGRLLYTQTRAALSRPPG